MKFLWGNSLTGTKTFFSIFPDDPKPLLPPPRLAPPPTFAANRLATSMALASASLIGSPVLGAGAGAGGATKGAGAGAGGASVGAWSHILRRRFLAGLESEGGPEENPKPFFLEVDPRFKSSYIFC